MQDVDLKHMTTDQKRVRKEREKEREREREIRRNKEL